MEENISKFYTTNYISYIKIDFKQNCEKVFVSILRRYHT